jgi:hypothetical protein
VGKYFACLDLLFLKLMLNFNKMAALVGKYYLGSDTHVSRIELLSS